MFLKIFVLFMVNYYWFTHSLFTLAIAKNLKDLNLAHQLFKDFNIKLLLVKNYITLFDFEEIKIY